jgi:hypothetical protein
MFNSLSVLGRFIKNSPNNWNPGLPFYFNFFNNNNYYLS